MHIRYKLPYLRLKLRNFIGIPVDFAKQLFLNVFFLGQKVTDLVGVAIFKAFSYL